MGFYHSHLKHTSTKRRADGKKIQNPHSLKSLVVACTPEAFTVCGKAVTNCVGIEVVQLTSLMGIGSLGRMIFPPNEKFHAWIAEIDATTQLSPSHWFDDSEPLHVLDSLPFPSEPKKNVKELLTLAQSNLMTAIVGPPGSGKTTMISCLLSCLLQHQRDASSHTPLHIFLCAPTSHAVQALEDNVSRLKSEHDFEFFRICSVRNDKSNGEDTALQCFHSTVDDRVAQQVNIKSLDEVFSNKRADITIALSTLDVLQKYPSVTYDPLKNLRTTFDWILIDEAGQIVDTYAYVLHSLLSRNGRYVLFGDPRQLSRFSNLRLSQRTALDAALHWNSKISLTKCFRFKGTLGHFLCQTLYTADKLCLHANVDLRSLIFVEISANCEKCAADTPRSSVISAQLESKILENLLAWNGPDELHYIAFYNDQRELLKSNLNHWVRLGGIHTVDECQGLNVPGDVLLSMTCPSNIGILSDIRRLNLSLTRTQKSTIIVAHSSLVNTNHPTGCVFEALRQIAQNTQAYVLFDNTREDHSLKSVLQHLQTTIGSHTNIESAKIVSQTLAQPLPATQVPIKEAVANYMSQSLARLTEEIIQPDKPEQESDSEDSLVIESLHHHPHPPPYPPPMKPRGEGEWAVMIVKKINCLTAKFQFGSKPCSMDCVIAQEQIISAMSTVFHWTPGQHKWVLDSIDILWALSRGAKPTGNKKTIHDYIGRKAKIMGLLPFGLFPGVRLEEKWSHPGTSVYTKELFTSEDFDFRKIVIEVISSGSADASLMALKK